MKKGRKDGICYDHISHHIYGEYVVSINIVAQKVPEKFVVSTVHDRPDLVRHMGQLGALIAEDLFPFIQENDENITISS